MIQNKSCQMTYFSFIYNFYNITLFVVCKGWSIFKKNLLMLFTPLMI